MLGYLVGEISLERVEIVDLDEEQYRRDEWAVRLYISALAPFESTGLQVAKAPITGRDEDSIKDDIAAQLREEIEAKPGTLFLLGPGSAVQAIGRALHVGKTLLGIDLYQARGRHVRYDPGTPD